MEFGVEIGEYHGVVRVPRRVFQRLLPERPTPERCVEAHYLQRTRFESIAERKLRRRQLIEDGECGDQRAGLARGLRGHGAPQRGTVAMITVINDPRAASDGRERPVATLRGRPFAAYAAPIGL